MITNHLDFSKMLSIKNHLEQWLHALFVAAVYRHWIDIDAHCELIAELLFVFLASYILDFLWLGPFQDPTVLMAHRILSNAFLVSLGSTTKYFTVAHPDAVVIPWVVHTRFAFSASGALNDVSFMVSTHIVVFPDLWEPILIRNCKS